jgi:bifunctional non-homologous end joining protein LigD
LGYRLGVGTELAAAGVGRKLMPQALAPAAYITPMKALGSPVIPAGEAWHCEIKFDGYRALAVINSGRVDLWSRNHKPLGTYPEIVAALGKLKCRNAVLDGEIVAVDERGRSRFQLLQGRDLGARPPVFLYVFDLLQVDGVSLVGRPIEERRKRLEKLVGKGTADVKLSPVFDVDPAVLLEEARKQELEGIILKRPGSLYEPDRRSGAWLKVKNMNEQEFVIGGFTPPQNSREYFGSIVVGYYDGKKLLFAGKVGSGFDRKLLASLHAAMLKLKISKCPFVNLPLAHRSRWGQGMSPAAMREVTWVRPALVAQVKFTEWTNEGLLRQPVFLGLRQDKPATKVRREASAAATAERSRRD